MRAFSKLIAVMAALSLTACGRSPREVVPNDGMQVYSEPEGGVEIGLAHEPLPILEIVYPDKTDYVLKVCFEGKVGFVRSEFKEIRSSRKTSTGCP